MRIGIDIGSTTVKVVLLDDRDEIIFKTYERHMSKVRENRGNAGDARSKA